MEKIKLAVGDAFAVGSAPGVLLIHMELDKIAGEVAAKFTISASVMVRPREVRISSMV